MLRRRGLRLGSLWWPSGASRWAMFHGLATDNDLAAIRNNLKNTGYQSEDSEGALLYGPGQLVLSEENQQFKTVGKITATMFMLPARPLFDITGQNGLNLLTLVDDRFGWWFRDSGNITVVDGETTWGDLFDQIAIALGVDINYDVDPDTDAIPETYLYPGHGLAAQYEQTPLLLDAVAYNVGQRIVVELDGSVYSFTATSSYDMMQDNISDLDADDPESLFIEGGGFLSSADQALLLPSAVRVVFPRSVGYVDLGQSYAVDVTLAELDIEDLGTQGNGNVKTFHDTCGAEGPTQSAPLNATVLDDLATQIATDWYFHQLAPLDAKFEGIVEWGIEGLSEAVEWVYVSGEVSTRVYRPAWNDLTEELLHGPAPVQPPAWIKVISGSGQTVQVTGGQERTIVANLFLGDGVLFNVSKDFTAADIGATLSGTGIALGTIIEDVDSADEAVMSEPATAAAEGAPITVTQADKKTTAYAGVVEVWDHDEASWFYWDQEHQEWVLDDGSVDWSAVQASVWFRGVNDEVPSANVRYQARLLDEDEDGVPIWAGAIPSTGAWVRVLSTTPQSVLLGGRQITDAVLVAGNATVSSPAQANFTSADVGKYVTGSGVPQQRTVTDAAFTAGSNVVVSDTAGFMSTDVGTAFVCENASINTTIASVLSLASATLNQTSSFTLSGETATIGTNTTIAAVSPAVPPSTASSATLSQYANANESPGTIQVGTCFLPVYSAIIDSWVDASCGFATGADVYFREVNDRVPNTEIYQCWLLDTAINGGQIWATRFEPPPAPPECTGPITVGTFVDQITCSDGQLSWQTVTITAEDETLCHLNYSFGSGQCLPLNPPPSPSPPPLPTDILFGGSDW